MRHRLLLLLLRAEARAARAAAAAFAMPTHVCDVIPDVGEVGVRAAAAGSQPGGGLGGGDDGGGDDGADGTGTAPLALKSLGRVRQNAQHALRHLRTLS